MMDFNVKTLDGADAGKVAVSDAIFGLEPREDILQRMVRYQLSKRQQGSHKALGRAEVNRTGARLYKQKGTGQARHHSARAPQFRGGGKAHGPVTRTHEHDLPKKVRALALRHALSAKAKASELIIIDTLIAAEAKTKVLDWHLKLGADPTGLGFSIATAVLQSMGLGDLRQKVERAKLDGLLVLWHPQF